MKLSRAFWTCYEIWDQFRVSKQYPLPGQWTDQPLWVTQVVREFNKEAEAYKNELKKQAIEESKPAKKNRR